MPIIFKSSIAECRLAVIRSVPEVIEETAEQVKDNIELETYRTHSGRMYPSRREPGAMHQASAPGESFASDTASLVSGMKANKLTPLSTEINFTDSMGLNRWAIFEFGGGRIAPRPTIIPTITNMQDRFTQDVATAILHALTEQELE